MVFKTFLISEQFFSLLEVYKKHSTIMEKLK